MAFKHGNQFWKKRTKHGREKLFESPEALWEACCEYFDEVENNPLQAAELVKFQGKYKTAKIAKMRAMTIVGLCIFLDIDETTWRDWRNDDDFSPITTRVDAIIRTQKFEGAAAELLNPNIIARELGLSDKKDHSIRAGVLSKKITEDMDDVAASEAFAEFLREDDD